MKPEPPIGDAIPYASAAPASGPIWSQAASTFACRSATEDDRRRYRARDAPARMP